MCLANVEKAVARSLVLRTRKLHNTYKYVADLLYHDELEKIANKECPFCGRKFKNKVALYLHLNRSTSRLDFNRRALFGRAHSIYKSRCYVAFQQMVKDVAETARKVKFILRKDRGAWVVYAEKPHPKFNSKYEAVKYIIENGFV